MLKKDLALALNISPAMVTRLSQRGMPTDTVERAQRWRKRHLEPGRLKPNKASGPTPAPPSGAGDWEDVKGAYVRAFEAAGADTTRLRSFFDDLMNLGSKIAPKVLQATTLQDKQAAVDREIRAFLDLHAPWPLDELIEKIASNLPPAGDTATT